MSTAVAEKPRSKLATISDFINKDSVRNQLALGLPKHLTLDRMIRIALSAASKNPLLLECTPESIGAALMRASETGLEPDGWHAHLIPFKNKGVYEAQYMVDYKGYVRLAYQSGMVTSCAAGAVHEKDDFRYSLGTNEFLEHVPANEPDRGPLVYAWAMVKLKAGGSPFKVLNRAEVMEHKKASKSADSQYGPWRNHEDAMWAKTAFRVLAKFIPLSPEMASALAREDEIEFGDAVPAGRSTSRVARSELTDIIVGSQPGGESQDAPLSAGELASDLSAFHERCQSAKLVSEVQDADAALRGPNGRTLTDDEAVLADAWKREAEERIRASRGERSNQKTLTE